MLGNSTLTDGQLKPLAHWSWGKVHIEDDFEEEEEKEEDDKLMAGLENGSPDRVQFVVLLC